jgi:argininosuccinate lyase
MSAVVGSTGRIKAPLMGTARRILFERGIEEQIDKDLPQICRIDMAHGLMLAEEGIIDGAAARRLLAAIKLLVDQRFSALKSRSAIRGLFLLYESYLIETQGPHVGGLLQTGRSRNDLNATLLRLQLREPYRQLMSSMLRLQAVLLKKAAHFGKIVMPAYTHGQPAEPITYGHYLAGAAEAGRRDIAFLLDAMSEIDTSPLGAGAVAGTSAPIRPARTAELLGFRRSSPNSVDAVASRDLVLRGLAALAIYGATLSRIATDLLQWLTSEFQFLSLPDELVGSSSVMPQKRNPFLLEHVQGRTAQALGAFAHAIAATRNVPFTNAISVGTESIRPLWRTLDDLNDAAILLRLVIRHAQPAPQRMLQRAREGFTNATAIALRMVMEKGIDFRSAHRQVGEAVTEASEKGMTSLEELESSNPGALSIGVHDMDPASCVARARYGGGPAPEILNAMVEYLRESWFDQRRRIREQTGCWAEADRKLQESVHRFCGA